MWEGAGVKEAFQIGMLTESTAEQDRQQACVPCSPFCHCKDFLLYFSWYPVRSRGVILPRGNQSQGTVLNSHDALV